MLEENKKRIQELESLTNPEDESVIEEDINISEDETDVAPVISAQKDGSVIVHDYSSPRWTAEYPDCSMPMTFDTYSNCYYGCLYCLDGDTQITMWDHSTKAIKDLEIGDEIVGVDIQFNTFPKIKKSVVLNKWITEEKEAFKVTLADGRYAICSSEHRWYTERGWKKTFLPKRTIGETRLTTQNSIVSFKIDTQKGYVENDAYMSGYLNGIIRGDGNLAEYQTNDGLCYRFRLAMKLTSAVMKAKRYLERFGIFAKEFDFPMIDRKTKEEIKTRAIRAQNANDYYSIKRIIKWQDNEDFYKGFLAGAYDVEGETTIESCRFGNTDQKMLDDFCFCLDKLGFQHKYHADDGDQKIVYFGGMKEKIRFQNLTGMDLAKCNIEGISIKEPTPQGNKIVSIESLARFQKMYDITTSTENFIANGMVSHNCFSQFQRGLGNAKEKYLRKEVHAVNVEKIKRMFLEPDDSQFGDYIKARKVMQWGGLSDQFDEFERRYGVTLELLKFFREIDYPLCFSTKATWWLDDPRYTELFKGNKKWNCKFSIITNREDHARIIEAGVDSPQKRIAAIEKYANLNAGGATLRLRPFIIGISNLGYVDLIKDCAKAGATAVSTEFFCVETRNLPAIKKFETISELAGFDIVKFYRRYSIGSGYLRLNRKVKAPFVKRMLETCNETGLRFYVSDMDFKDACHNGCCCGLSEDWNYSRGQMTNAICIAKKNGVVHYSDISKDIHTIYSGFPYVNGEGLNTNSTKNRANFFGMTMEEHMRYLWNSPKKGNSPYRIFRGSLVPMYDENKNIVKDENGDIVYKYIDRGNFFEGVGK